MAGRGIIRQAVGLSVLFLSVSVFAQRHENFAERPSKRQEAGRQARDRAQRDKEEARLWAAARGLPMRRDDGVRVRELMAIRNGRPVYYTTLNKNAAISTAANLVRQTAPFNVDGSNVTVAVWDGGSARTTHFELTGRVQVKDGSAKADHATHVSGTIAASGINTAAKGMAPAAKIDAYDWAGDVSEMTAAAAAMPGETDKVYLSNHSYGYETGWYEDDAGGGDGWHWDEEWTPTSADPWFGQYVWEAFQWDGIVFNAPYFLPFKAAGNDRNDGPANGETVYYKEGGAWFSTVYDDTLHPKGDGVFKAGYDTLLPVGTAKNIMTVGAVGDAVSGTQRSLAAASMADFSGWGPADDGRIKPDIVANGVGVNSSYGTGDMNYQNSSGTSMASPNACGSAALLIDYYGRRFPGQAMLASTLKGLIIHTADDLGNPGPDYSHGWGLMNTLAAAELIKDYADGQTLRMTEDILSDGAGANGLVLVSDGYEPIRVTLCWTDPPGSAKYGLDDRTPVLINDLDLTVTGPTGTHYPYKLSYADPSANATATGKNNIDNVEQVYLHAPVAGEYAITVDCDGTLSGGEQAYSLWVSGIPVDSDADGMSDYWETVHFGSPTGAVASADSDGDGADNLAEYVSGHDPNQAHSVFRVSDFVPPATSGAPFVVSWESVPGRIYRIVWTGGLPSPPFSAISGDLPYPAHSYTDTVERAGAQQFYRVEVR